MDIEIVPDGREGRVTKIGWAMGEDGQAVALKVTHPGTADHVVLLGPDDVANIVACVMVMPDTTPDDDDSIWL